MKRDVGVWIFWFVVALVVGTLIYEFFAEVPEEPTMTITLERNTKLEDVAWKGTAVWYLTRPMREDEIPEIHTFQKENLSGLGKKYIRFVEIKEETGIEEYIDNVNQNEILKAGNDYE